MSDFTVAQRVRLEIVKAVVAQMPAAQLGGVRVIVEPLTEFVLGEQPAAAAVPPLKMAKRTTP